MRLKFYKLTIEPAVSNPVRDGLEFLLGKMGFDIAGTGTSFGAREASVIAFSAQGDLAAREKAVVDSDRARWEWQRKNEKRVVTADEIIE